MECPSHLSHLSEMKRRIPSTSKYITIEWIAFDVQKLRNWPIHSNARILLMVQCTIDFQRRPVKKETENNNKNIELNVNLILWMNVPTYYILDSFNIYCVSNPQSFLVLCSHAMPTGYMKCTLCSRARHMVVTVHRWAFHGMMNIYFIARQ